MDTIEEGENSRDLSFLKEENYDKVLSVEKRYYIEDIEKEFGITRKTYYNWEKAGKVPKAKRDPMSRYRYWTVDDIKKLKKIAGRG